MRRCSYCGEEIEDDSMFCRFCGNNIRQYDSKLIEDDEPLPNPSDSSAEPEQPPASDESGSKWKTETIAAIILVFVTIILVVGIIVSVTNQYNSLNKDIDTEEIAYWGVDNCTAIDYGMSGTYVSLVDSPCEISGNDHVTITDPASIDSTMNDLKQLGIEDLRQSPSTTTHTWIEAC